MKPLIAVMLTLLAMRAGAQDVRPMTSAPTFVRACLTQAEKEGRDWPDLSGGEDGTIVHFSGNSSNADMIVTSSADEARILEAVRTAVLAVDLPKTDFLERQGTSTASVDAEFNDSLVKSGRDTRFTFPIARLLVSLRASKLPSPFVVAIEKEGQVSTLFGAKGRLALDKDRTLFSADELSGYETLENRFHLEWWAPLAALAMGGTLLGLFSFVFWILAEAARTKPPVGPKTPEEAQAAYDAQAAAPLRKMGLAAAGPFLLISPFLIVASNKAIGAQAFAALPEWFRSGLASPFMMVAPFVLFVPMFVVLRWKRKANPLPKSDEPNPLGSIWPMFVAISVMLTLLVAVRTKPDLFRTVPREYMKTAIFAIPLLGMGASAYVSFRRSCGSSRLLPTDDPVSIAARELGDLAGVQVRRVVEKKHGGVNAFATLFGTVGVTAKLRETLDEAETRAVLAHEIGHLKVSDPGRFLALSLTFLGALLGFSWWLRAETKLGESMIFHVADQMFFIVGLPFLTAWAFSPRRRRAEHAADLFALHQTGDVDLVARALTKIHDANLSPHRLHPRDERFASHPALEKRLARLHEAAETS